MANTYTNTIAPEEVSLALEHLLIAPVGTAWAPGRINVTSPPAGFIHMGAVADDSPQISVAKTFYDLKVGIPAILAYRAVTDIVGEFGLILHSNGQYPAYLGTGGLPAWNLPATGGSGDPSVFYAVVTGSSRTALNITSTSGILPNDMIITGTTAGINTSRNYGWVNSIVDATSLTLAGDGFKEDPVNDNPVVKVAHSRLALGTAVSPQFHILGVADFLNGAQVVHDMPKAQPRGQWTEALRNQQHVVVGVQFDLFGSTITSPHSTAGQVVVGERIMFPPTTIQ